MTRISPSGLVAIVAFGGATLVPNQWVQHHLALRFGFVFLLAAAGLPFLVALLRRPGNEGVWPRKTVVIGGAFAAWAVLSALVTGRPGLSLLGHYEWATGAVFVVAFVGAWSLGISAGASAQRTLENSFLAAIGFNAGLAVLQSLANLSRWELGLYANRAPGLWTNPVYFGGFVAAGFWIVAHRVAEAPLRWGALAALTACAIELSGSRFALAILGACIVAALFALGRRRAVLLLGLAVMGLAIGALVGHGAGHTTSSARALDESSSGFRPRLETWRAAPTEIAGRPVFGTGPDRFERASGPQRTLALARTEGPDEPFTDAHNVVLEYFVTTGIPGGLLATAFLVAVAFGVLRSGRWHTPLAGFGLLLLATHLVEPVHVTLTPLALLALGAAAAPADVLTPSLAAASRTALVAVAAIAGLAIAYGTARLFKNPNDLIAAKPDVSIARTLLPVWALPLGRSAQVAGAASSTLNFSGFAAAPATSQARVRSYWAQAAEREPDSANWWYQLARFDDDAGSKSEAEVEYRRALHANPWSPEILDRLAALLARSDHFEAQRLLTRSLEANPSQPAVVAQLHALGGVSPSDQGDR